MKKVLSFSLWGDNPTYNIGAIKNAEMAPLFYPEFECWFYVHKDTVPSTTIDTLKQFNHVKIIIKEGDLSNENCKPRMWRFEPIDDPEVEIMMVRDTDTRFLQRESLAVAEWMKSDKIFHIMRDHPHHGCVILAGMFGSRKIPQIKSWSDIMKQYNQTHIINYDQDFLRDHIYPNIKDNAVIHASFHKKEINCQDFPIKYDDEYRFVGEYVYFDESRSTWHIDELKRGCI